MSSLGDRRERESLDLLEIDFVDLKPSLEDARSQNTTPKNVLFCWGIISLLDDVYPIQETKIRGEIRSTSLR